MKKFNLFTFFILLIITILLPQNSMAQTIINAEPQKVNNIWYSAYINDKYTIYYATSINSESSSGNIIDKKNYTIVFEYPASNLSFDAQTEYKKETQVRIKYYTNNNWDRWWTTGNINTQTRKYVFPSYKYYDNYGTYNSTNNIPDQNCRSIEFEKNTYYLQSFDVDIKNVRLQMSPHIILLQSSPENHNFGTLEYGSSSAALPIKFHSFLSKGTLSVKIKGDNPTAFRVDKYINATDSLSKIGNTKHDFTITYDPNSIGNHSAIIEISDDVNKKEIKVSGTCIKKTPTLKWNISNFKFAAGDTIFNPATSSPAFPITYSTSNESIIKIKGDTLVAIGAGDVEISASMAEQEYYNATSITQTFTVTNKTIQYIDWEHQNFYMLKLGDSDQQLSAVAKDKLTDEENKNTITYTSSDKNVVKIEGSTLKIVGTGRASITASVEETETYAGATATKVVFVRESSDDCSTTFAIADTETYSESYSNTERSIKKTFEWQDIIGEILTFTANGDIANIEVKDNTNNKTISLTSSNNTYTGNIDRNTRSITITIKGEFCWFIWETFTISLSNIFVIPASYIEPQRSNIEFSATEIGKTTKETVTIDWANQPDFIHASIIEDPTNSFSIDPNFATIIGMCGMSGSSNIKVRFNPKKEGVHSAKMVLKVGEKDDIWDTIPLSGEGIYCETKFIYPGDWNDISNWSNGIPGAGKNTIIETNVTIPNNYTAEVNDLRIGQNGTITIAPQGALKVVTSINNTTTNNLTLQANDKGSAILVYNNTTDNKVKASVQLYSIASSDGLRNGQPGNFKNPKWQYLGIVTEEVAFSTINPDGSSNWIFRWDETTNATSCWAEELSNGSTLSAWTGYCLAQEAANTYNYSGTLINGNHTYPLTYTPENASADLGNNLLTNSYTAPIDITTISDANFTNAEANIYIYNTGSYLEWKDQTELEGFNPGQIIVIPVNTISALGNEYPRTIASAQAFFVKATDNGALFAINYEENVFGSARKENVMRTKKMSDKSNWSDQTFNSLKIQVTSSTSNDRLYLLEHDNTTADFDNGYDAEKIFDNPNGPQIYASTAFGCTSINTDKSFDGQYIGFVANNENELYTLSFDIENLHSYEQLWLYDTETELYVDILNQEEYQFYGTTTPNNNRFYVTSINPNAPEVDNTPTNTETTWEDILTEGKPIYLYTTTGQLVATLNAKLSTLNSKLSTLNTQLPTGVYIVKSENKTMKLRIIR